VANNVNVTNRGFEYIAYQIGGSAATYATPAYIGWGTANGYNNSGLNLPATQPGSFPTALSTAGTGQWSDVGPYSESTEARVKSASTTVTNNVSASSYATLTLVGTITAAQAESIGESFLAPAVTKAQQYTLFHTVGTTWSSLTISTAGGTVGQYYQMNNEVIFIGTVTSSSVWTISRTQNGSPGPGTANTADCLTFGNIPGAAVTGAGYGDMFAHAGFQALSLNSGDSIQFTWQVNVTS
jgi:hypothetical protein